MKLIKSGIIITARLKSSRLAKKLLLKLGSKSVIEHVIIRSLKIFPKEKIILCTSKMNQDDPLEGIDPVLAESFTGVAPKKKGVKKSAGKKATKSKGVEVPKVDVADVEFPDLVQDVSGESFSEDVFSGIPVKIAVELGRSNISLKEVYELSEGSIVELNRLVGEPLDLVVNGQIIGHGEVVAVDNNYGLRITSIVSGVS